MGAMLFRTRGKGQHFVDETFGLFEMRLVAGPAIAAE